MIEGGVTDEAFCEWAEVYLIPVLNPFDSRHLENSVVVLDNAGVHHSPRFRRMLQETGCFILYLSPYSPDYNPIEFCFHSLKADLRRRREEALADFVPALDAALLYSVTPTDMAGFFRYCGYPSVDGSLTTREEEMVVVQSACTRFLDKPAPARLPAGWHHRSKYGSLVMRQI